MNRDTDNRLRICVVGSGTRFVSGISYYTYFLSKALASHRPVSVILMRRLIPRILYPGRKRVGAAITELNTAAFAPTFDGVDWFGVPSAGRAAGFLQSAAPDILILQWWTGSVLPWYLLLARKARKNGARIVVEFHEDLDTGEARLPVIGPLLVRGLRRLIALSDGFVVHSEWDAQRLSAKFALAPDRFAVVPHGPFPMAIADEVPTRNHRDSCTIMFFGTIRPYKGLEFLVRAFELLPRGQGQQWRLLVVGETWEGWTLPLELIAASPYGEDIELVNRYVTDDEVPGFFQQADIVALPYLRSSASGPLQMTMSTGLPVVLTSVGGLVQAADGYSGAVLVPSQDSPALAQGLEEAARMMGRDHADPRSWDDIADAYVRFLESLTFEYAAANE